MTLPPGRVARVHIYRSAGLLRRRRVFALAGIVALVAVLAVSGWAWSSRGGGTSRAGTGPDAGPASNAATTPGPAKAAASSGTPRPSPSKVIEIGWVGDTTPGSVYGQPPDNGRALFAHVRDALRAPDLMIANLEGTYSTGGASKCSGSDSSVCFAFQAPPSYAKALTWAGVDLVNLANNHAHDYLESGMQQTQDTLDRDHVAYTGLPDQIQVVDVDGVKVAVLGFSPYPWSANINDIPAAEALVRRAAGEADVVVVLIHAGAEGADRIHTPTGTEVAFGENRGDPRAFAHAVVGAGADLVLGSGPHVIRGIERYHGRLIAYSLGNFAGWDNFGIGGNLGLSGLLTVKVDTRGRIHGGRWLSLRLAEPGVPVVDASHTSARLVDQLSATDFPKTFPMDAQGRVGTK